MGRDRIIESWRKEKISKQEMKELGIISPPGKPEHYIYDATIHPHQAFIMCSQYGSSISELGELFGTTEKTIRTWIQKHREFNDALRMGRDAFNTSKIEKALVTRALGYEYEEVMEKETSYKKRENGETIIVPVKERIVTKRMVHPDVEAQKFFLKNRAPERWRDTQTQLSITQEIGNTKATVSGLSTEDVLKLRETVKQVVDNSERKEITN